MFKKLLYSLLLSFTFGISQDNSGCLTKHQIMKMQYSSIEDIRSFLNKEAWYFYDAKADYYNSANSRVKYNFVSWEKNGEKILVYSFSLRHNVFVYQTNSRCFNVLLNGFSNGISRVDGNKLKTSFKENSLTVDFYTYKNNYSNTEYVIWVYNSSLTKKEAKDIVNRKLGFNKNIDNSSKVIVSPKVSSNNNVTNAKAENKILVPKTSSDDLLPLPSTTEVYESVDEEAEFPGSLNSFRIKIGENFDNSAMEGGEGTLKTTVTFIVERDGTISDVIATGSNSDFNNEAVRTVKSISTKWIPAKIKGQPVRQKYRLPLTMNFE